MTGLIIIGQGRCRRVQLEPVGFDIDWTVGINKTTLKEKKN
jgi:hypothetical protein